MFGERIQPHACPSGRRRRRRELRGADVLRALVVETDLKPGDWVLVKRSGGVSVVARAVRMMGCRVIATSSSDAKFERLGALVEHLINYRTHADWGEQAFEHLADGVDLVVRLVARATCRNSSARWQLTVVSV